MSVQGVLQQVPPSLLNKILQKPALAILLYEWDTLDQMEKFQLDIQPEEIFPTMFFYNVDAIFYLLNGKFCTGSPMANQYIGGNELSGMDDYIGYQPVLYLHPDEVRNVTISFSQLSFSEMAKNFDLKKFLEDDYFKYQEKEEEILGYFFDELQKIINYYKDASKNGNGMFFFLT
jgi:Domain of unknown function (DUF1877)